MTNGIPRRAPRRSDTPRPSRPRNLPVSKPDLLSGAAPAKNLALGAGMSSPGWLTVADIAELKIPRSTWEKWRQKGQAPRSVRLSNGQLRIRRDWLNVWIEDRLSMESYG